MTRDTVTALTYSILIILISVLIVSLSHSLHQKELLTPTAQENDLIFTTYFQTGNPLHMTDIKGITENEVEHMFAVRKLLLIASILAFTLGIFLVVLWEKVQEKMAIFLSPLLILWVSAPAFLFSNFDKLFLTFHRILFPQGNYFFPESSVLISTYPATFFATMGLLIVKYYLFISVGLLFIKIVSDKIYVLIQRF